jgi:hypothetical protein
VNRTSDFKYNWLPPDRQSKTRPPKCYVIWRFSRTNVYVTWYEVSMWMWLVHVRYAHCIHRTWLLCTACLLASSLVLLSSSLLVMFYFGLDIWTVVRFLIILNIMRDLNVRDSVSSYVFVLLPIWRSQNEGMVW